MEYQIMVLAKESKIVPLSGEYSSNSRPQITWEISATKPERVVVMPNNIGTAEHYHIQLVIENKNDSLAFVAIKTNN